jgi:hypothetical protein
VEPARSILLEQHRALKSWQLKLLRRSAGRHSEIFEYQATERPYPVVVKRILDSIRPENARAAIVREFESLQTVRRCLPQQMCGTVPEPLMVLPDSRALVLQALAGRPLTAVLKWEANRLVGPLRRRRMTALGELTGSWLKQLHQATLAEPLHHDSAAFLDALEVRFAQCRRVGVSDHAIDGLRRALAGASNRIEGRPIPAAARQGDFIPQNILVDGARIGVVDFESFSESDSIYEDVGTFVSYLQALSAFPYYSQKALVRLASSFLHAYGLKGDEVALKLYRARALVVFMSEIDIENRALYGRRRLRSLQAQLQQICVELDVADTVRTVGS